MGTVNPTALRKAKTLWSFGLSECKRVVQFKASNKMGLNVYGYTAQFFHQFSKGNNFCDFLFASVDKEDLPKWDLALKEKTAPKGANSFLLELTPIEKVKQKEVTGRVDPP